MHCYLYAYCKTKGCPYKLFIAHSEVRDAVKFIDYPDDWFPVSAKCPECGLTHRYAMKEVRTETSPTATHPKGWKPIFRSPPGPREID